MKTRNNLLFVFFALLLAVAPPTTWAQTESIDFTAQGFANSDLVETVAGVGCTVDFALGSNTYNVYPRYYDNGTAVRVYGGNTFTVTATGGLVISEIDFTFGTGGNSNPIVASTGSYASGVWTGSATEVTFQVDGTSGHRRLRRLVVTYESEVPPPTFNLYGATTTFLNSIQVRIEAESGATIRYTTDGSTPTGTSPTFVNNLTFNQTTTLKAIAIRDGMTSNVATLLLVKDAGLWSGTGTRTDPFVIDNTAKLDQLASRVNAGEDYANTYFVVTADIAYACSTAWNNVASTEHNYTRIGTSSNVFRGHFDGGGHTISGIRVYHTSSYNYGLFGCIGSGAEVRNVVLENCRFTVGDAAGAIAGRTEGGSTVENCHVMGDVCIHDKQNNNYHGGVVGYMYGGTVRGCTCSATLSIDEDKSGWDYGGIAGRSQDGDIFNCLAIGVNLPDASHFTVDSYNQRPLGAIIGGANRAVSGCLYYDCHFGDAAATSGVGRDYNSAITLQANLSHTLTSVTEGVTLRYDDDDPNPDVVEVYPFGLAYNGKLYAAQGASVTFAPVAQEGRVVEVAASGGTLTRGADGTYTLVMPAEDVTINAIVGTEQCEIRYELYDNYNDGWNGAAIVVEDVATQNTLATWTIEDGNTASGTLEVENGQFIRFRWVNGGYDYECSYVVYNAVDDEILNGYDAMGTTVDYTVNCNICPNTYVLSTADITPTSAVVNWPERSSAYNIRYRPVQPSDNAIIILTVGNVWNDGSGYQMLLDADHTAYGTIIPESSGLNTDGNASPEVYAEFEYKIPENADGLLTTQHVVLNNNSSTITIPAGTYDWCITNPSPGDRVWIASSNGNVSGRQDDFVFQAGHIYEFVISLGGSNDRVDLTIIPISSNNNEEWTAVSDIHSPYTIASLSPDTWYEVQVQADCGASGTGEWNSAYFSTLSGCVTPIGLEATDILSDGATLSWSDYQDGYHVRYRTLHSSEPLFFEGFEGGIPVSWTKIDSDGDGNNWLAVSEVPTVYSSYYGLSLSDWVHSGNDAACSPSYANGAGAFNSDQWLITPQLELQGTLRFYAKGDYSDEYEVLLSTTGTTPSDFTTTLQSMTAASGSWDEIMIDLSQYAGQTGYIAIHHVFADGYFLLVDDFGIYQGGAGNWQTVEAAENTLTISGLTANTRYQWQVQGVDCDGSGGTTEWSESAFFTTALPSLDILANQWYAIAALAHDMGAATLDVAHIGGLTDDHYDLFRYNEADGTWENQKASAATAEGFTTFDPGRGYIYRRTTDATLTFDGIPNIGSYSHTLTSSCLDDGLRGFNLIGNPYPHAIYKGMAFPTTNLATGFYSLQTNGTWLAHPDTDPIGIGQGVLVQVEGSDDVPLLFDDNESSPQQGAKSAYQHGLQFTLSGLGYTDVAFALFDHRNGLRKVSHLNTEAPALSIPIEGTRYAIATIDGATEVFPLEFDGHSGEYTIAIEPIGQMGYLHLIDRIMGKDINLLHQPAYSFTHSGNNAMGARFLVKLSPNAEDGIFAYPNGNSIVVEGTGTLQVFDVMGRQLFTHEINSQSSILNSQFPTTGVYLFRLVGNDIKTQKIVIKK